jgi:hypothetical protein
MALAFAVAMTVWIALVFRAGRHPHGYTQDPSIRREVIGGAFVARDGGRQVVPDPREPLNQAGERAAPAEGDAVQNQPAQDQPSQEWAVQDQPSQERAVQDQASQDQPSQERAERPVPDPRQSADEPARQANPPT